MISHVQLTTTDAQTNGEILQQRDACARAASVSATLPTPAIATVEPHSEQCASIMHLSNLSEPDARARLHELVAALPRLEPLLPLSIVHSLIGVLASLVAESSAFTGTDSGAGPSSASARAAELDAVRALAALAASGVPRQDVVPARRAAERGICQILLHGLAARRSASTARTERHERQIPQLFHA